MGYFYFDESIQKRGGFIIGAFVYSEINVTPLVNAAVEKAGFNPEIHEFKSGARMDNNPKQTMLRKLLFEQLNETKIGIIVIPFSERAALGNEAIAGLEKILVANSLDKQPHKIFMDNGIIIGRETRKLFLKGVGLSCDLFTSQDSIHNGGIQLADMAAHCMGGMLLEELGLLTKMVPVGDNSGYDSNLEIELGFELWARLRYQFFMAQQPNQRLNTDDSIGNMMFDVEHYGLHVSESCNSELKGAATQCFGTCYLGCIY